MNLLITGGTGFVGEKILEILSKKNEITSIYLTTRNPSKYDHLQKIYSNLKLIKWDSVSELPGQEISSIDAVINLQGENISNGRWTEKQKERIYQSRVSSSRALVSSLIKHSPKLKTFIQTSAIGIYPANKDGEILNEGSQLAPEGFLADVCKDWENSIIELQDKCRLVTLRVGVVLDSNGGAIAKMKLPFMMGVGGILGNGKQLMSWIHRYDLAQLYCEALVNNEYEGVFNAVAPDVVTNYQFTKALGSVISRPTIFPVPAFMLKLLFGEMSSLLLDSQHVECQRLKSSDFKFQYPTITQAFEKIFS